MAVATPDVAGVEDRELDERALTEYMTVLADATDRTRRAPGLYSVTTQSGREYLVDAELPACECPDYEYRDRICKHIRRVQFATERREIPEWAESRHVDEQLGMHVDDVKDSEHDTNKKGDRDERDRPTRSEPADFGGDSTGVQDL